MEVSVNNVTKQFMRKSKNSNVFEALKETNLTMQSGKLYEIMGRSGSGKSTLLNIIGGLLTPTGGSVVIDGLDIYQLDDSELSAFRGENIGVIPQMQTGLASLNVYENIVLPLEIYGLKDETGYAYELMEKFDIAHLKEVMISELSGGEMRRMAIARALIRKPKVLLADEPTSDLDDENTQIVLSYLQEVAKTGIIVLLVTHESEALKYADEIYRMSGGVLTKETVV